MSKTYQQYCPMSYSLDVIGDRWTLLIVRNLMFGALRYSDLKQGLPGLASNLLSTRLKTLQDTGVIEQQVLPPPANVDVYALTERGRGLRTVIKALTDWGVPYLQPLPPEDDFVGLVPFRGYLSKFFASERAEGVQLTVEMRYQKQRLIISIADGHLRTGYVSDKQADLILTVNDLRQFVGLLNKVVSLEDALHQEVLILDDIAQRSALDTFLSLFDAVPTP